MADEASQIPNQLGMLTMSLQGTVLSSTGELEQDAATVGATVFQILQDTQGISKTAGKLDPFKRLTIQFSTFSYVVTMSNNIIYLVKKSQSSTDNAAGQQ